MANSANVYVEQTSEGSNVWAPPHARLCGEGWIVEVNPQSREGKALQRVCTAEHSGVTAGATVSVWHPVNAQ